MPTNHITTFVNPINLFRDNLPSLQLQTWEMNANMYDVLSTAGPVPTIFSDDQQATIDALVSDPVHPTKTLPKSTGKPPHNSHICNKIFLNFNIQKH
jgi:hypothetical protein